MSTLEHLTRSPRGVVRLVGVVSGALGGVSRRSFVLSAALAGTAVVVDPKGYLLRPQTAYATICGPAAHASNGWTAFCCTINKGVNACPPGSFAAGWWKAADSSWCCGGYRYIVDCNARCTTCSCGSGHLCAKSCWNCRCSRGSSKTCDQRRVCCNAFRYGQYNTHVRCSGGVVCRVASCVPPYTFEACTRTSLRDDRTTEHKAPCLQGCGPILTKYTAMGAQRSYLDASVGPERAVGDRRGRHVRYQGGAIYWSKKTGAKALNAGAVTAYLGSGGPRGPLGYPRADSAPTVPAWTQKFEGGVIAGSSLTTPQAVWGPALAVWTRMRGVKGELGFPSGPRAATGDGGWIQPFRYGAIVAGPRARAAAVTTFVYLAWIKAGGVTGRYGYPLADSTILPDGTRVGRFVGGTIRVKGPRPKR